MSSPGLLAPQTLEAPAFLPQGADDGSPALLSPALQAQSASAVLVYRQVLTWILFWPLLTLIARQAVYFSGPARTEAFYKGLAGPGADYHLQLYIILLLHTAIALAGNRRLWGVLRSNPLILAGLGLAAISALWSGSPQVTAQTSIELALCTLFACYLTTCMSTERLMGLLMFMGVVTSVLSILFVISLPSYGIFAGYAGGAWQGICNHKNTLGLSLAYLLTPVFFADQYRRWPKIAYAVLILFMIYMSQSRGAWLYTAGMLTFVACLYLLRRLRRVEALLLFCLLLLIGIVLASGALTNMDNAARVLGKDPSLSGRTVIYREVWQTILRAPILGYGYGAFWGVDRESTRIGIAISWFTGYSESGVLELALYLGFTGVAIVALMLARAVLQAVRLLRSPFYSNRVGWFLTMLFLAALTNLDAGWLLVSGTLDWVLILVACIGLNAESRHLRARHGRGLRELLA
jgi:exopolysaccharide production protein ExoQ